MKVLVLYDSQFGNTKKIAEIIESTFKNGFDTNILHVKDAGYDNLRNVDVLIVGTPTHAGSFTKKLKKYINNLPDSALSEMKVIAFDTSIPQEGQGKFTKFVIRVFKNAAPRLLRALESKGGQGITSEVFWVLDSEGPIKEGELDRAINWAESIIKKL